MKQTKARWAKFYKVCPGGNTTVLITSPIITETAERVSIAHRLH